MSMNRDEYRAYVSKLEEYARKKPNAYRFRVGLLAALGYGYLLFLLTVIGAFLVWLVLWLIHGHFNYFAAKLGVVLVPLACMIIRSLWITFPRPEGIALDRNNVPQLFIMLDEVNTQLKAPRFHHVLLNREFNASIVQVPRLGIFGWQSNYLLLGLPLMQSLPQEQFRAILAHEVGHLSGNHSRFSGWIYRVRVTWSQLMQNFEKQQGHIPILEKFLKWYVPFFNAYTFALARGDEYSADRCSVEVTGATVTAQALININIKDNFLDSKYWTELGNKVLSEAEPPAQAFSDLAEVSRQSIAPEDSAKWLREALNRKTDYDDTHPALTDRLTAIGFPSNLSNDEDNVRALSASLPVEQSSAASLFLGAAEASLTASFDESWRQSVEVTWRKRHAAAQESRTRLAELEDKAAQATLTPEESIERAQLVDGLHGSEHAIKLLQDIVAGQPEDADANMGLGVLLLQQGDERGILHLNKAVALDSDYTINAYSLAHNYLERQGRHEEAKRYRSRAEGRVDDLALAKSERSTMSPKDIYLPHDMPAEVLEELQFHLARLDKVAIAYLTRKQVAKFPEQPLYVLGFQTRGLWYLPLTPENAQKMLLEAFWKDLHLGVHLIAVPFDRDYKWLRKKLKPVKDSKIYDRAASRRASRLRR